jgi:ABC-type Zn uptake system ZnuABC Zn-binding protein ZnuA
MNRIRILLGLIIFIFTAGCQQVDQQGSAADIDESTDNKKLQVVATTTIVGDVVSQVGGELIKLSVLSPVGTDPHGFDATPQDVAKLVESDIVFANGAGLEDFLESMIESAGAEDKVIYVSDGIKLMLGDHHDEHKSEEHHDEDEGGEHHDEHEDEEHHDEDEGEEHHDEHENEEYHEHGHDGNDPHTWFSPSNVMVWAHHISEALGKVDSENSQTYIANEENYREELTELDAWIREQVEQIPEMNRNLVTDHSVFAYYGQEYGFTQVGALIPGYSTLAEPTAKELAQVEDAIEQLNVKAVFVGYTFNPALAERVTSDTGTQLVFVYTGSLSEPEGEASTYLNYMRYNTTAFVNALK